MKFAWRHATAVAVLFSGLATTSGVIRAAEPISDWGLEPSSTGCVISRSYGLAKSPVLIGMKAMPEGGGLQLAIVRPAYRRDVDQSPAEVAAGPAVIETTALSFPVAGRDHRSANLINLSAEQAKSLRKAATLSVRVTASTHEDFDLGPMAEAWASLDSCVQRLRDTWNVENIAGRIATPPEPIMPLNSLFSSNDYPRDAIQQNQSGTVVVQLLIDESGAVKDCTLAQTSGITLLDSRSCGIIVKGAKFKPATDIQGRPVKSSTTQHISWLLS